MYIRAATPMTKKPHLYLVDVKAPARPVTTVTQAKNAVVKISDSDRPVV
jgi:hypothetical protein